MSKKTPRTAFSLPNYGFNVFFTTEDGKPRRYIEPNEVDNIPENEKEDHIYKLLEDNCDVKFCVDKTSDDFKFITLEYFVIFATDSNGNCFGSIGGAGNISDREYPIGYVTLDGKCGILASHFKEFLELVIYYPYWREVINVEKEGMSYSIKELQWKYKMNDESYLKNQEEISKRLGLKKNEQSLNLLLKSLSNEEEFVVFNRRFDNLL